MKAAYIQETGPPEVIIYGDLPKPEPSGQEVLVKVSAVALNPVDTYIRSGANYWELPKPFIVGSDVAGVVETIGPNVQHYKPGDRVWATNQGLVGRQGTFAEYSLIDECWLYPTPDNIEDETVAACALVGVTAHLGLFREAKIKQGETLFVHGGTGGVGSMVIQMAKSIGARVIATGGSDEKTSLCRELGADFAINYKTQNVTEEVKKFASEGVDVFWETLREPNFDQIVAMLAPRGRIVLMAGRDARPEFPVGPFYVKGCSMHGFVMFAATHEELRNSADDINRLLSLGGLKARITHRFSLSETAEAHRLQEENTLGCSGTIAGKIVLTP